ncbi:uncharacterized protein TNCV_2625951 [Trichonephila clavipes]|uniref:Uncharacterized protein n=1 Tax=Trichonephila clavipes TaxID=2585209 RepID=A0A8X6W760_TRICX|nr:uncharacterized protein TNCV_2625951 [Trichonephila clavipes]
MIPYRTCPCRAAYSNASGLSGSVTGTTVVERCSGKASIGFMTNEKCLKHPRFYTFQTGCDSTRIAKGSCGVFKCVRHSTNMDGQSKAPLMSGQTLRVEKFLG